MISAARTESLVYRVFTRKTPVFSVWSWAAEKCPVLPWGGGCQWADKNRSGLGTVAMAPAILGSCLVPQGSVNS